MPRVPGSSPRTSAAGGSERSPEDEDVPGDDDEPVADDEALYEQVVQDMAGATSARNRSSASTVWPTVASAVAPAKPRWWSATEWNDWRQTRHEESVQSDLRARAAPSVRSPAEKENRRLGAKKIRRRCGTAALEGGAFDKMELVEPADLAWPTR